MMNEGIQRDPRSKADLKRPNAEVVILKIAAAELLVQSANARNDLLPRQQAEANHPGRLSALPVVALSPLHSERFKPLWALVGDLPDQLGARNIIGHRPDDTNVRVRQEHLQHPLNPACSDDGVVVE